MLAMFVYMHHLLPQTYWQRRRVASSYRHKPAETLPSIIDILLEKTDTPQAKQGFVIGFKPFVTSPPTCTAKCKPIPSSYPVEAHPSPEAQAFFGFCIRSAPPPLAMSFSTSNLPGATFLPSFSSLLFLFAASTFSLGIVNALMPK